MAEIYRASLTTADGAHHDVAIKRLLPRYNEDEEFITMLADEARITAALSHPNIAQIFEFGVVDGQHVLVMEFVDGVDLRSLLKRCREREQALSPTLAAYIVERALRGLHYAHTLGGPDGHPLNLVHRDFSPSNILVGYDGQVKLIDFGIAKGRLNRAHTRGGVIKGKVKYMSPEQTLGRRLDVRSDVFAAGVVLYYAVTGQLPFYAPSDAELMVAIREQEPDAPSRQHALLDPAFDALVMRALRKDPEARFPTAAAFADGLAGWFGRESDCGPARLGRLVSRVFAHERAESGMSAEEFELDGDPEPTPSHEARHYTRLVDPGHFTGGSVDLRPPPDPVAEIDAWLAARRADEEDEDGDFWVSGKAQRREAQPVETEEETTTRQVR
jgi:serine/threonine protein kinase